MSGTFVAGENKTRPGNYIRYENAAATAQAENESGVVAAVFQSNWGPLGVVKTIGSVSEGEKLYGTGGKTGILKRIKQGGATTVKPVRIGTGGAKASLSLKDTTADAAVDVVKIEAAYPGTRAINLTIRDAIADTTKRELLVCEGTTGLERFTFSKGGVEVAGLLAALTASGSDYITATKLADGNGTFATVTQSALFGGADPTVTSADYSAAFTLLEAAKWDVLVVDTNDDAVATLVGAFIERVCNAGMFVMGVVGQAQSVAFATRLSEAAALNSAAMVYVLNGWYGSDGALVDGYNAAALVAGLLAATPANQSLTHTVLPDATDVGEALTNAQVEACIRGGALTITGSQSGSVWIESAVNTLVSPADTQDEGWKKIRRTKTRYELMNRVLAATEPVIGKVDNDKNGRATLLALAQGVANEMVSEGKLLSATVEEDATRTATVDSAWFTFAVIDRDSIEKAYWLFRFQFGGQ